MKQGTNSIKSKQKTGKDHETSKWIIASVVIPLLTAIIGGIFVLSTPKKKPTVTGRIINDSSSVSNQSIYLYDQAGIIDSTKTDVNGTFGFTVLSEGNYYLQYSEGPGLTLLPFKLSDVNTSLHIPVNINELIELRFVASTTSDTVLLIFDGIEMFLISRLYITDKYTHPEWADRIDIVGRGIETSFYTVKGYHTYEYSKIIFKDKGNFDSLDLEKFAKKPFRVQKKLEKVSREFNANEEIFIKGVDILTYKRELVSTTDNRGNDIQGLQCLIDLRIAGYKGKKVSISLGYKYQDKTIVKSIDPVYSIDGKLGVQKDFLVAEDCEYFENVSFFIPVRYFEPYDKVFLENFTISQGDENLTSYLLHILYFKPNETGYSFGTHSIFGKHLNRELADVFMMLGKYDDARNSLDKIIKDETPLFIDYFNLGKTLLTLKEYKGSLNSLSKAIGMANKKDSLQIESVLSAAYLYRGLCYEQMQNFDSAIIDFKTSIQLDSTFISAYKSLSSLKYHQQLYGEAIGINNRIIAVCPTTDSLAEVYGSLSWYYLLNRQYAEAISAARKGLDIDSTQIWINANLAHGYLLSGKYESAKHIYQRYKKIKFIDKNWTEIILEDFEKLGEIGIQSEGMKKITKLLR